ALTAETFDLKGIILRVSGGHRYCFFAERGGTRAPLGVTGGCHRPGPAAKKGIAHGKHTARRPHPEVLGRADLFPAPRGGPRRRAGDGSVALARRGPGPALPRPWHVCREWSRRAVVSALAPVLCPLQPAPAPAHAGGTAHGGRGLRPLRPSRSL